ncbi:hypothetical protein B296_00029829 [Ensete ventricosum]|uniref:Uncharacterized protein n=1 Tax=Ensete ventricosum TaxID=4639 RepID=A0A427AK97_ENSVE|nr:hypothetical protein B296_00029829 [Ensete ventricosum]
MSSLLYTHSTAQGWKDLHGWRSCSPRRRWYLLKHSAAGDGHPATFECLLTVVGVDVVLQARVLLVLTEARLLFLQLGAAGGRRPSPRQDRRRARAELQGVAGYRRRRRRSG